MKRILATTTILAMTAGFAAAEVTLSGDARMGIISDFGGADTAFTSRARVTFTLSGESDSGFSFGASFGAHDAGPAASGTAGSVYISANGFKLSMGDVDGAAQAAVGQVSQISMTDLGSLNEINYIGAGGASGRLMNASYFSGANSDIAVTGDPTLLAEYSAGALSLYASLTQINYSYDYPLPLPLPSATLDAGTVAIGAAYTMGDYKVSAGYEMYEQTGNLDEGSAENFVLGADATFGAITMKARYSTGGSEYVTSGAYQDHTQVALSATYTMDALSLTAFVSDIEIDDSGVVIYEREAYGLGASYDLGGGAKVVGGYAKNSTDDDSAFDLGLSFSF